MVCKRIEDVNPQRSLQRRRVFTIPGYQSSFSLKQRRPVIRIRVIGCGERIQAATIEEDERLNIRAATTLEHHAIGSTICCFFFFFFPVGLLFTQKYKRRGFWLVMGGMKRLWIGWGFERKGLDLLSWWRICYWLPGEGMHTERGRWVFLFVVDWWRGAVVGVGIMECNSLAVNDDYY